jgi:hypothetical protein
MTLIAACARDAAVWDPIADPALPGESGLEWPEDAPLPPEFETPPWVTMPAPGRISIGWRTTSETTGRVELTADGGAEPVLVPTSRPARLHHVDLGVLPEATGHRYRVVLDGSGAAREGVFTTPGLESFRFIHLAEFHAPTQSEHVARFAGAIRDLRPHLAIESGDMLNDGDDDQAWVDYLRTSQPWISNLILLPAHSNHVNGMGGNPILIDTFDLPGNERWYSTRYGVVELVTLDSTYDGENPDVALVPTWIEDSMIAARDAPDPPRFLVGAWHYPACSSSYASRSEQRRWVIDNLVAAFRASGGIDLILVGHDKYYERSFLGEGDQAIVHVMANAGKLAPENPGDNEPECTPVVTETGLRSMLMVGVSPDVMEARVVDEEGNVIDEFSIVQSELR